MNQDAGTRIYFPNETDARKAAAELMDSGYDAEIRSEGSHGQSFWESVKAFFGAGESHEQYREGAVVLVHGDASEGIHTIAERYNGRMSAQQAGTQTIKGEIETPTEKTRPMQ